MRAGTRMFATVWGVAVMLTAVACGGSNTVQTTKLCRVAVDDASLNLEVEQAENAATIAAVGLRRGIEHQGIVVALATARQESKLRNLDYGDRDSKGLFQQRPSQGWGDEQDILDPQYAADRFYEHLEQVSGWQDMSIADAAQAVQRSAYPGEYARWTDDAELMTKTFTGKEGSALNCSATSTDDKKSTTSKLSQSLSHDWGDDTVFTERGKQLQVPAGSVENGWQYALWLVAHSDGHSVTSVQYNGHKWSAKSGSWDDTDKSDTDVVVASLHKKD